MRLIELGAVSWNDRVSPDRRLGDGDVELILTPHWAPAAAMPQLLGLLAPDDRKLIERYAEPEARDRAIASRAVLRLLLAQHLGLPPAALEIAPTAHGKPLVRDRDPKGRSVAFNLSHTDDLLLFGFARAPIGVDIERIAPIPDLDAFARLALSDRERAACAALPVERRLNEVYRHWVAKEAIAKRSGEGLRRNFSKINLSSEQGEPGLGVTLFVPQDGTVAAFAAPEHAIPRFHRIFDLSDLLRD